MKNLDCHRSIDNENSRANTKMFRRKFEIVLTNNNYKT